MPATPPTQRTRAIAMLLLANLFWGLSFPLIKAIEMLQGRLMPESSGFFITACTLAPRYLIALAALVLISRLRGNPGGRITPAEWKQGLAIGAFATAGMFLQIDGLRFTAASTSAFITQFYAIMIPVWLAIRLRRNPGWIVWTCCALVLAGVAILGRFNWQTMRLGRGELETLLSSVFFMGQILWLENKSFAGNRPIKITMVLFIIESAVFSIMAIAWAPHPATLLVPWTSAAWVGLTLLLAVFCTLAAFSIMNAWQPKITATEAGLLYCIEPVFGSILALFLPAIFTAWGGMAYANESVTFNLLVGGGLITVANILIQAKPPAD